MQDSIGDRCEFTMVLQGSMQCQKELQRNYDQNSIKKKANMNHRNADSRPREEINQDN